MHSGSQRFFLWLLQSSPPPKKIKCFFCFFSSTVTAFFHSRSRWTGQNGDPLTTSNTHKKRKRKRKLASIFSCRPFLQFVANYQRNVCLLYSHHGACFLLVTTPKQLIRFASWKETLRASRAIRQTRQWRRDSHCKIRAQNNNNNNNKIKVQMRNELLNKRTMFSFRFFHWISQMRSKYATSLKLTPYVKRVYNRKKKKTKY